MKYQPGDSYKVDKNTEITDLFQAPEESNFDSVISVVDGFHPADTGRKRIYNQRSQKAYYILEGEGKIHINGKEITVDKGEFVNVPKQTKHALEGDFKALIVTSPPFNPEDEELVEK